MEHTFNFRQSTTGCTISYRGSETLYDTSAPEYKALACGNDLIDKFKAYYKLGFQKEIPRPYLFVIDCQDVNAFAVYEESLKEYCIGIYLGAFRRIREKTEEIVDMVIERSKDEPEENKLIPQSEREKWIDFVYINAMRFFVAHEYSHILNGHIDKGSEGHFEFAEGILSESENLFQQMKEFDADETAMNILCYMNRSSFETKYRIQSNEINRDMYENGQQLKRVGVPEALINMDAQRYINAILQASDMKVADIRQHFKYLMLGVNVVFLVLDERRKKRLDGIADKLCISREEREGFYFTSGLRLIRMIDHPIPALRLDAVTRIMDENIEGFEGIKNAEEICKDVSDYVWKVEILRCENDVRKLYIHIAHTPTAQDFIQEIELLWQKEKEGFMAYIEQLEKLFYQNRIVDMNDDGTLV